MDYEKRIKAVRSTIDGHRKHLYSTLGAIYAFRMEAWTDDDDKYVEYAEAEYKKQKWSWTTATKSNKFLSAVRLAFESDEDTTNHFLSSSASDIAKRRRSKKSFNFFMRFAVADPVSRLIQL